MVRGILHHFLIALTNDGNQKVHEHGRENDDIQGNENHPNNGDHEGCLDAARILLKFLVPDCVLWSHDVTNRVLDGLEQVSKELAYILIIT